ncbi:hypothetical protein PAECIP111893_02412 [Paenibacillus plantiphilus]|uniref:Uncharacterized protein n=1 Tax=Paenibacillus plantiphilus TaxID=2905650 RepID=A0ABN8GCI6_9BACL|nr:hypothetical protein [Paenibacillus plantiphilus]CAH1205764.1 hypothetical protein PAECIP111893_02412 [Paenibacillus plantiphilus]
MNKEEKINILNELFVTDWDTDGGEAVAYMYIENTQENVFRLLAIGVPEEEIADKTDFEGIEISSFVFSYGEAEYYQNGEFLDYTP